jgi:putative ABC transport system permease protein
MVTHNEILAKEYSDRIITMSDGNVISDCVCNEINDKKTIDSKKTKKIIPLLGLLKTSFNNLRKKLVRTLLMIFACSIGIVALCLVITVVSGMSLYIGDVQGQALKTYPITINSVVDDEEPEKDTIEYEEYPSDNKIHVIDTDPSYYGHVNTFTNEFMNHIRKMDKELYSAISYSGWVKTRLLSEYGNGYYMVSNYSFLKEIPYDYQYLEYEYDVLEGELPKTKEDLVLDENGNVVEPEDQEKLKEEVLKETATEEKKEEKQEEVAKEEKKTTKTSKAKSTTAKKPAAKKAKKAE